MKQTVLLFAIVVALGVPCRAAEKAVIRLRAGAAAVDVTPKAVLAVKDKAERDKLPPLAEAYARNTLWMAGSPESITVPVQALAIGDLAVCGIPFEAFAEIGLDLKKHSPFPRTMVIGLANGNNGYLPTPKQHELGGYETWLGGNRVQKDASVILTKNLLEMLGELHKRAEVSQSPPAVP